MTSGREGGRSALGVALISISHFEYRVVGEVISVLVCAWFLVGWAGTVSEKTDSEPNLGLTLGSQGMPVEQSKTFSGDNLVWLSDCPAEVGFCFLCDLVCLICKCTGLVK